MNTKSRIIEEALRQFNEKGLNCVGVRDIARSLEISPGNMSYHFPKKEELVLQILTGYSADNQRMFIDYSSGNKSVKAFLELTRGVFRNQYNYRGLLVELVEINRLLSAATDFDYSTFQTRRINEFRTIFEGLREIGELDLDENKLEHLVSYISLFGRFWISEAFLDSSESEKEETINRYLNMFAFQLELFATSSGKSSIQDFRGGK